MVREKKPYQHLETTLRTLPESPGIYQYFDSEGKILYVGKAKNLKKRVSSYFTKDQSLTGKVKVLVKKIAEIRHIVVDTELEALLLENNLIKSYQPRYNIMLKDDKTFPWLCIKNEPFPRVFSTRNPDKCKSEYFGPYASVKMMNTLLELVRQLYPLRTCSLQLTNENIRKGKFKVCLQYHIGNCKGPCEMVQTEEDYMAGIAAVRNIIKGNLQQVKRQLITIMSDSAKRLEFEQAHFVKEKIELLDRYRSKSTVVNPSITNVDVFSLIGGNNTAYVNYLKIVDGAIIQSHTVEVHKKLDESDEEVLSIVITEFRQRYESDAKEVLVPFDPGIDLLGIHFIIPKRGDKLHLLELSLKNARYFQLERQKQKDLVDPEGHSRRMLATMQKDLALSHPPQRIECFDNSNIQGAFAVASVVVFTNAQPTKKEYRHFNIRTVTGPDDFASMEEIVYRRYKRMLDEKQPLPQLIVIDGGKGQLNAALHSLEKLEIRDKVEVIGIAKRLEELYRPGDPMPLYLDKKSETLKVIQRLRDEAHRFAIAHHRKRREKGTIKTELIQIRGIDKVLSDKLLSEFGSIKNLKKASLEQIRECIGPIKGAMVYNQLQSINNV